MSSQLSTHTFLQEFETKHGSLCLYSKDNEEVWSIYQSKLNFQLKNSADKKTRKEATKNLRCRVCFYEEVDKQRSMFEMALKNADTVQLASNVIELQTKALDYLSNGVHRNSKKPHANDCTPVRRVCNKSSKMLLNVAKKIWITFLTIATQNMTNYTAIEIKIQAILAKKQKAVLLTNEKLNQMKQSIQTEAALVRQLKQLITKQPAAA
ncbi:hypothetical protein HDU78_009109 [Chytriomyces hyalinus]|nr:hypothetical protein HDU78_009109 [Chytriomyces hyalinus]